MQLCFAGLLWLFGQSLVASAQELLPSDDSLSANNAASPESRSPSGSGGEDVEEEAAGRLGFLVPVDLPLIGDRDEQVRRQVLQIADSSSDGAERPTVVLKFAPAAVQQIGGGIDRGDSGTRGSQFERCLALARFLTGPEAARVRLIAYLPQTVIGHAVLPVLACEEIVAGQTAELGRAAVDEGVDLTIEGAYRDIVSRRATLPEPIVLAMLDPQAEVYALELTDGSSLIASRDQAQELREAGRVLREETVWQGGGLASFSGQQLRARRWIARTISDENQLTTVLGLSGSLRTVKQLPREWAAVSVTIAGTLNSGRVNQIIRSLNEQIAEQGVNLVLFRFQETACDFRHASRLASFIAELDADEVYTLSIVLEPLVGAESLIAVSCREAILLSEAELRPAEEAAGNVLENAATQRELADLASRCERPLPLLSVLADPEVRVQEYVNQETGKRAIFANWQVAAQGEAEQWLPKRELAGDGTITNDVALKYRLIDYEDESEAVAIGRLGLQRIPEELSTPWLDSSIQMLLSQGWLPRLLLMIGFFALMAELGNPGIGAGGFIASVCFVGFFWIEGLNGNVEWLEILLFIGGLVALAIELFVIPGFGIFGIGGLLMLFVSVVLASQTFVWPTTSAQLQEVSVNLFWVACLALGGMIGLLFMHKHLERSPVFRWVTLHPDEDQEELAFREAVTHREHLLGQEGLAITRLNPSGKAQFGRDIVAVVGSGNMIDEGVPVRVVEVRGNLVIVEEIAELENR